VEEPVEEGVAAEVLEGSTGFWLGEGVAAGVLESSAGFWVLEDDRDGTATTGDGLHDALRKAKREAFDLVINATSSELSLSSLGLADEVFAHTELAYDLMYRKDRLTTVFLQHAKDCHVATTSDGLGMLIEQAAQAFDIWHDIFPETAPVLEKIESHLLREHLQRMGGSSEQDFQNGTTLQ
jgi:hypothetical protein